MLRCSGGTFSPVTHGDVALSFAGVAIPSLAIWLDAGRTFGMAFPITVVGMATVAVGTATPSLEAMEATQRAIVVAVSSARLV